MIRINLVPQKRSRQTDKGQQSLLVGVFGIIVCGALAFFFVHQPLADEIDNLQSSTRSLDADTKAKKKDLKGYKELKEAVKSAQERSKVVTELNNARATPAYLLHELSNILSAKQLPTMTRVMSQEVRSNPNRELSPDWDAKHVWITSLVEKNGDFRLEGGAQSDSDMTQLALRLQASVYFRDVIPEGGQEASDKDSGISYYKFTITGKVAY